MCLSSAPAADDTRKYPSCNIQQFSRENQKNVHKVKGNSLKYLGQDAVRYPPAVLVPARSVLAATVRFVSEFTVNKQNCQVHRVKEWNRVRETWRRNDKMFAIAQRIVKAMVYSICNFNCQIHQMKKYVPTLLSIMRKDALGWSLAEATRNTCLRQQSPEPMMYLERSPRLE